MHITHRVLKPAELSMAPNVLERGSSVVPKLKDDGANEAVAEKEDVLEYGCVPQLLC